MKHNLSNDELRVQMDEEARAAEAAEFDEDDGAPLPDHVTVSRPNRARSKVLQVRLNPDEMEALEAIAYVRNQPVSTVAREELLALIDRSKQPVSLSGDPSAAAFELIDQVLSAATQLRDLQRGERASRP